MTCKKCARKNDTHLKVSIFIRKFLVSVFFSISQKPRIKIAFNVCIIETVSTRNRLTLGYICLNNKTQRFRRNLSNHIRSRNRYWMYSKFHLLLPFGTIQIRLTGNIVNGLAKWAERKWFFKEMNKKWQIFNLQRFEILRITMSNVHMFWPTKKICISEGMNGWERC